MLGVRSPGGPLGSADHRSCNVKERGALGSSVEDERAQVGQLLVVVVTPGLEAVDVVLLDAQRRIFGSLDHGGAEVGPDVEQVVLDVRQDLEDIRLEPAADDRHTEGRVGLVDIGIGVQPQIGLLGLAHVAEAGGAGVAGAGVDTGEVDHGGSLAKRPHDHISHMRHTPDAARARRPECGGCAVRPQIGVVAMQRNGRSLRHSQ